VERLFKNQGATLLKALVWLASKSFNTTEAVIT